jgi:FkbM family methyltransferase
VLNSSNIEAFKPPLKNVNMTFNTTFLTLNDGTKICAPADINLMSNFVLQEQGDWFESEIHFVRSFIKEGMFALDIGANYGLYSTAIANGLGSSGKLWCFEPTENTANALRQTIKTNQYNNIELIQAGLSDHLGKATFYTSDNAELNSLTASESTQGNKQTIELLTLDGCYEQHSWAHLDFIKLDAEGEELNILKGAHKTLSACSPLIMFELKHGKETNTALISAFKDLGYESYYLIPSLNILCPLDLAKPIDAFQLNLFCCKPKTAQRLAEQGFLVNSLALLEPQQIMADNDFFKLQAIAKDITLTETAGVSKSTDMYLQAYHAYVQSRDESLSASMRVNYLNTAFEIAKKVLSSGESKIERLITIARVTYDIGHQSIGNQILQHLITQYIEKKIPFEVNEIFVAPSKSFELIAANGKVKNWFFASILDQFICKHAYSCYFTAPQKLLPIFQTLKQLDLLLPQTEKRWHALQALSTQART